MLTQIIKAANALAFDKGLRGRFHIMLVFKRICLGAVRQPIIFNLKSLAFQQVNGFETKRADMLIRHHAIDHGFFTLPGVFHRQFFCNTHKCLLKSRASLVGSIDLQSQAQIARSPRLRL